MKAVVLGLGLAGVILATVLAMRGGETHRGKPESAAGAKPATATLSADAVLSIKRSPPKEAAPPTASRASALLKEYLAAKSYEKLHAQLAAKTARTPEEEWMLASILETCAVNASVPRRIVDRTAVRERFIASLSSKDSNRERRMAAFDAGGEDRCGTVARVSYEGHEVAAMMERAAAGGEIKAQLDMLRRAYGRIGAVGGIPEEQAIRLLRSGVESADPVAVEQAASMMAMGGEGFSVRAGPEELPVDFVSLSNAAVLAGCDLGKPCGRDHPRMRQDCMLSGRCSASDVREHLFYYGSSPHGSQLMHDYYRGLLAATQGDWSHFSFHRGPSPQRSLHVPH